MPPKQQLMWNLSVHFHFGMHMTCPAQCHYIPPPADRETAWRLGCFVQICNTYVSRYMWKTVFRRKQMKKMSCFQKESRVKEHGWVNKGKENTDWIEVVDVDLPYSQFEANVCFILALLDPASSSAWGRRGGKTDSQPAENTCRHANTTWEGAIGSLALCLQIHKCQVMNIHTAMKGSL